uniref:Putative ribosomal N-acetyltransferase YdaF n=1 Tax=Anthurium amnicola TaxID=1678845 RepID=A0A1D1Y063_9ARAE
MEGDQPEGSRPAPAISLRGFDPSDADDLWDSMGDDMGSYNSWAESCPTRDAALDRLRASIASYPWFRTVCLDDNGGGGGGPVGYVAATPGSGVDRCRAEVSYGVARRHRGRGVATAAVRAGARQVFEEWPHLERLEGLVAVENVASQRVMEKAGFSREGLLRSYRVTKGKVWDLVSYSLVRADWKG